MSTQVNAEARLEAFSLPQYAAKLHPVLKLIAAEGTFKMQQGEEDNELIVVFSSMPAYIDPTIMKRLLLILTQNDLAIGVGSRNQKLFFTFKNEQKLEEETGATV